MKEQPDQNAKPVVASTGLAKHLDETDANNTTQCDATQDFCRANYDPDDDPQCLTWTRKGVARAGGFTSRHLISLEQRGLICPPKRAGRKVFYLRRDVLDWLAWDCPTAEKFAAMRRRGGTP